MRRLMRTRRNLPSGTRMSSTVWAGSRSTVASRAWRRSQSVKERHPLGGVSDGESPQEESVKERHPLGGVSDGE